MAFFRHFIYAVFIVTLFLGCTLHGEKYQPANNSRYNFDSPFVIKLPVGLAEISGIAYYPKDTSVFAIEDENGLLYKISLTTKNISQWRFDKRRDFEDVVLHDSIFYVLISNGDIEALKFGAGDSIFSNKTKFLETGKNKNEFESMYFDDSLNQLIMVCKDCETDGKKNLSAWGYNIASKKYTPSILSFDVRAISEKLGEQKIKFKPSATAINPVTNDLYILSSINHLLVVTSRQGKLKELFILKPAIYKQPEGIAFTTAGDIIIANEWNETGLANILIIKNKLKNL